LDVNISHPAFTGDFEKSELGELFETYLILYQQSLVNQESAREKAYTATLKAAEVISQSAKDAKDQSEQAGKYRTLSLGFFTRYVNSALLASLEPTKKNMKNPYTVAMNSLFRFLVFSDGPIQSKDTDFLSSRFTSNLLEDITGLIPLMKPLKEDTIRTNYKRSSAAELPNHKPGSLTGATKDGLIFSDEIQKWSTKSNYFKRLYPKQSPQ
jgi:hypothetical protein